MLDQLAVLPGLRMERRRRSDLAGMTVQHFHSFYELYYLLQGRRQYFIRNKVYRIEAGAVVFIPPGHIHRTIGLDEAVHERVLLEIDAACFGDTAGKTQEQTRTLLERLPPLALQLEGDERSRMEWLLAGLFREAEGRRQAHRDFAALHLAEILLLVLRKQSGTAVAAVESEKHRKVYEIADHIAENYAEITSLDMLCASFYISKSHLCHIFKEVAGMTIQEYLTATRIQRAQQLLAGSGQTVTAIACGVGYGSITHFERMFKRQLGMTPLQYRAANRQEGGNR